MCSIFGYYSLDGNQELIDKIFNENFYKLLRLRGRDGFGFYQQNKMGRDSLYKTFDKELVDIPEIIRNPLVGLANCRAEPTTEYVENKQAIDQQPYFYDGVWAVHNGTIYNDKEITKDCDLPTSIDSYAIPVAYRLNKTEELKGSQATAVWMGGYLFLARTYNPLYLYLVQNSVWIFSSQPLENHLNNLQLMYRIHEIPPYCSVRINQKEGAIMWRNKKRENANKAVVCCSGGLDATVSATVACQNHDEITLLYFDYGCKATTREKTAVNEIFEALKQKFPQEKISLEYKDFSFLKNLGGSTLTEENGEIGVGEAAAEHCIDWVPARNTAFIGLLASYCDRFDIGNIYLGLNLEEASAFSDNSEDFYRYFQKVLDVGTHSCPQLVMPLGNLMKHEIVKLGLEIGAPLDKSWSCYKDEDVHCGECGSCTLRKKAFAMNGYPEDVVPYKKK